MRRETATTASAHRVGAMTWDAVAARLGAGAAAILPVGAGAKQHGRHLPMESDLIQAGWLAEALAARIDALVWPTLAYGHYPAFAAYAGSCSLSADLFAALVGEVVTGLSGYGPAGIVILDTGISTNAPIARAVAAVGTANRVLHLPVYRGPGLRAAAAHLAAQPHGSHADEIETSIMLALAPDRVAMARAEAGPDEPPGPGPMQHADPGASNFSASGSIGDPRSATEAKGRALLAAMVEDMSDAVARWRPSAIR